MRGVHHGVRIQPRLARGASLRDCPTGLNRAGENRGALKSNGVRWSALEWSEWVVEIVYVPNRLPAHLAKKSTVCQQASRIYRYG